mgnify:CR=1 FL=1|tara:strand:- start:5190 stop:6341 length:1152 start_codon:yes stop_codon:yes gene_type:complete
MDESNSLLKKILGESRDAIEKQVKSSQVAYHQGAEGIDNLFELKDLEDILEQPGIFENIRFNKDGKDINAYDTLNRQNNGHIHIPSFLLHINKGETCIVHKTEQRNKKLRQLCIELTHMLKVPVSCNIYLTPAHQKAFPPHTDPHDVLIVQVAGKKLWHIEEDSKGLKKRILKTGDILYIPRNTLHNAESYRSNVAYSMHLTFVIKKIYSEDLIAEYMSTYAEESKGREIHLTHQSKDKEEVPEDIKRTMQTKSHFFNDINYKNAKNKLIDKGIDESTYMFGGSIGSVLKLSEGSNSISRNTILKRTQNWYRTSGTKSKTLVHLKQYELSIPFEKYHVDRLLERDGKYQIKSLGNADEEAYMLIISEILVKRGILVICNDQNS